jgi:hypothetical protein
MNPAASLSWLAQLLNPSHAVGILKRAREILKGATTMLVKFLSGPRKGEISHAPRTQQTQLLIDAGLCEAIPEKYSPSMLRPPTPAESAAMNAELSKVSWGVGTLPSGGKAAMYAKRGTSVFYFSGATDQATRSFVDAGFPPPPADVLADYLQVGPEFEAERYKANQAAGIYQR